MASLAEAVHYAHKVGVVHRDIKPSNIMLVDGDSQDVVEQWPCILDFGLASLSSAGEGRDPQCPPLTAEQIDDVSSTRGGTPPYMAPEQFQGRSDARSDVWSMGVTLFELLTLRQPFAASDATLLRKCIDQETVLTPNRIARDIPSDLEAICLKCLEKDPQHRYATANQLSEDLKRFLRDEPTQARPLGPVFRTVRWCRRHPAVCAVVLTLLLLAGSLLVLTRRTIEQRDAEKRRGSAIMIRGLLEDDLIAGLPWLLHALELDRGDLDRETIHHLRIAAVLQQSPQLRRFWLCDSPVVSANFNRDGTRVLTVCTDGTASVWSVNQKDEQPRFVVRSDRTIRCAAFSPDGRWIFTGETDGQACLRDAATGEVVTSLPHPADVHQGLFSTDGRLLVTCSGSSPATLSVWQTEGFALLHAWTFPFSVNSMAVSPSGRLVAVGSDSGEIRVWETNTYHLVLEQRGHRVRITSLSFSPDENKLLSTAWEETCRLWETATGTMFAEWRAHDFRVQWGEFSADGRWILTTSWDDSVRVWEADTQRNVVAFAEHSNTVNRASFNASANAMATASDDRTGRVVQLQKSPSGGYVGKRRMQPLWHADNVHVAAFVPGSPPDRVLTASQDGGIRIWEFAEYEPDVLPLSFPTRGARFSESLRSAVIVRKENSEVAVWTEHTGVRSHVLPFAGSLSSAFCSDDAKQLVTVSQANHTQIWNMETGSLIGEHAFADSAPIGFVAFSPTGRHVALVGGSEGAGGSEAVLWDVRHKRVAAVLAHDQAISFVAFDPRGERILTASRDCTVQCWSVDSGEPVGPPMVHASNVIQALFSPDCKRIVTSCWDDTARVYDLRTSLPLTPPLQHRGRLGWACFSPDGQLVATCSNDSTVRVWCSETGEPVTPALNLDVVCGHVAFSEDSQSILMLVNDGVLRWNLPQVTNIRELANRARLMTAHRLDSTGSRTSLDHAELRRLWERRQILRGEP